MLSRGRGVGLGSRGGDLVEVAQEQGARGRTSPLVIVLDTLNKVGAVRPDGLKSAHGLGDSVRIS